MNIFRSYQQEDIQEFTTFKDRTLLAQNLIVCETPKIIKKLFEHNVSIKKILCTEDFLEKIPTEFSGNVYIATSEELTKISGFKIEYKALALAEKPADSVLNKLDNKIFYLNGLSSPENVGSIMRSLAAFDINSLIIDAKSCSPYVRRAIRVSMGNIFQLKIFHSKEAIHTLNFLKAQGYLVIGTANRPDAKILSDFSIPEKAVFIIGSEGHGIDEDTLKLCDVYLKIPINETVAHLNASHAANIFMYELSNRKRTIRS